MVFSHFLGMQIILRFPVSYHTLIESRNSNKDVGKKSWVKVKKNVEWADLIVSNMKRSEESVRVLEETSKMISPKSSKQFQALRFELYDLEKRIIKKL